MVVKEEITGLCQERIEPAEKGVVYTSGDRLGAILILLGIFALGQAWVTGLMLSLLARVFG